MPANKKPRKRYRPKASAGTRLVSTEPWRINNAMNPIERFFADMERSGECLVNDETRVPVFKSDFGDWHEVIDPLLGLIDFSLNASRRHGWGLNLPGLTAAAHKLQSDTPIDFPCITACRTELAQIRRHVCSLTMAEANDLVMGIQIEAELEKLHERRTEQ